MRSSQEQQQQLGFNRNLLENTQPVQLEHNTVDSSLFANTNTNNNNNNSNTNVGNDLIQHLKERIQLLESENSEFEKKQKEYSVLVENEKSQYLSLSQTLYNLQIDERNNQQKLIEFSSNYFSLKAKNEILEQRVAELQKINHLVNEQNQVFANDINVENVKNTSLSNKLEESLFTLQNFFQISQNNYSKLSNVFQSINNTSNTNILEEQVQRLVDSSLESQKLQSELYQQANNLSQTLEKQRFGLNNSFSNLLRSQNNTNLTRQTSESIQLSHNLINSNNSNSQRRSSNPSNNPPNNSNNSNAPTSNSNTGSLLRNSSSTNPFVKSSDNATQGVFPPSNSDSFFTNKPSSPPTNSSLLNNELFSVEDK
eukprot:TRINITY_DN306_c0_g1_i2.p1 TRINITY_DN306_c0_g1~~TRINITY_DN306_c0_g1_i2.p1  ORF type:complete len:369 (-),score=194.60 TRINITY_DN306_c0_g1_i2:130-1236(-)